ncbi:hypothetical protein MTR_1g111190 [Medicago truncatula]|uniref:Uncharacterized protein n=1 Tax=Medicago truncatula TaxID=3880 RepID=A0A072W1U0_MEDTR|nr:hypothetical protein MTR_1g111190 [Medicago truncatula]
MAGHSGGISTGCLAVFLKHIHISVMYHTPAVSVSILKSISFLIFVSINAFDGPRHPVSYDDIAFRNLRGVGCPSPEKLLDLITSPLFIGGG